MELRILEKLDNILRILQNKIPKDNYMDIGQVAEYSAMSRSSIRRACQEGRLKYVSSQGKHLYKLSSVEAWLQNG